ncbi:MAG TPA: hypothetical protein VII87_02595 [Solirubrobacteraceae bacterium]
MSPEPTAVTPQLSVRHGRAAVEFYTAAFGAGATEISPVTEEHRWLLGRIEDPFGHHWEIGRPLIPWPPG